MQEKPYPQLVGGVCALDVTPASLIAGLRNLQLSPDWALLVVVEPLGGEPRSGGRHDWRGLVALGVDVWNRTREYQAQRRKGRGEQKVGGGEKGACENISEAGERCRRARDSRAVIWLSTALTAPRPACL